MQPQIQWPRDVIGGLLTVVIGAFFLLLGRNLEIGASFRMGPGYFPTVLSVLTIILGSALTWKGVREVSVGAGSSQVPWLSLLGVIGSVVLFGLTIRGIGIAPAVALVVFVTASCSRCARWTSSLALAAGMAAFCTLLFVKVLGLSLPIVGPWLSTGRWPGLTLPIP